MLISDDYRRLNEDLHRRATFGQRGSRHAEKVKEMLSKYGSGRVLDYGCGRATLGQSLPGVDVVNYDPAILVHSKSPPPCHIVICTDVLEHIEPECLDAVLRDIRRVIVRAAYIVIATKLDGRKKLADGRDPHLIVQPPSWWDEKLNEYFPAKMTGSTNRDCTFLVEL